MKTKNVFFVIAISALFIVTLMTFFADKVSIGVTHY